MTNEIGTIASAFVIAALVGCGGASASDPSVAEGGTTALGGETGAENSAGAPAAGGAFADESSELDVSAAASYRVPVSADLEAYATYPVPRVDFKQRDGVLEIRYGFPRWLIGESERIELVGTYTEGATSVDVIAGELGSGVCTRSGTTIECFEHLPYLQIDREKAAKRMVDEGLPALEIEQRLRVTDRFAVDPIGILSFDAR